MTKQQIINRLVATLGLALDEIHNPGRGRHNGYDIVRMCEGVIKEATKQDGIPKMIVEEAARLRVAEGR